MISTPKKSVFFYMRLHVTVIVVESGIVNPSSIAFNVG